MATWRPFVFLLIIINNLNTLYKYWHSTCATGLSAFYPLEMSYSATTSTSASSPLSASSLLTTITDLEGRLAQARHQLAWELQQLSLQGHPVHLGHPVHQGRSVQQDNHSRPRGRVPYREQRERNSMPVVNTSIRLQHHENQAYSHPPRHSRPSRQRPSFPPRRGQDANRATHVSSSESQSSPSRFESVALSSVLRPQEEVTFRVIVRKNEAGEPEYTTLVSLFDGTQLSVVSSELAPSLVGVQSTKPGEILYRFIDDLKENGHLKRTFTIAPWKLCSVVRDGQTHTLEELRRAFLQSPVVSSNSPSSDVVEQAEEAV